MFKLNNNFPTPLMIKRIKELFEKDIFEKCKNVLSDEVFYQTKKENNHE